MEKRELSAGAKAGIAVGCFVAAILVVTVFLKSQEELDAARVQGFDSFESGALPGDSSLSSPTAPEGGDGVFGKLKSVTYSDSGNMLGNLYAVDAVRGDDGGVVVTIRKSAMHSDPIEVGEYRAADDLLDRIEVVIDRAGMKEWGELPQSEFIALDASTESLSALFESADPGDPWPKRLSYSFDDELPDGGGEAIREIHGLMLASMSEDRLIRAYTE